MPALDALVNDFRAANTQVLGASVDSAFSHAAFGESLGGVSFPLLSDFHPRGAVANSFGLYLADKGITDRGTVIIDAGGVIRHLSSVTTAGRRDMNELLKQCQQLDAGYDGPSQQPAAAAGLSADAKLFVREPCTFSAWALAARGNLHLGDALPVVNVSRDAAGLKELEALGGKAQAPALLDNGKVLYESADIIDHLVGKSSAL